MGRLAYRRMKRRGVTILLIEGPANHQASVFLGARWASPGLALVRPQVIGFPTLYLLMLSCSLIIHDRYWKPPVSMGVTHRVVPKAH